MTASTYRYGFMVVRGQSDDERINYAYGHSFSMRIHRGLHPLRWDENLDGMEGASVSLEHSKGVLAHLFCFSDRFYDIYFGNLKNIISLHLSVTRRFVTGFLKWKRLLSGSV